MANDLTAVQELLDWANTLGDRLRIAHWYNNPIKIAKVEAEIGQLHAVLESQPRMSEVTKAFFRQQAQR